MAQMTFAYKVRDGDGKLLEGTIDADNSGSVASRLRQMGYTPVNIEAKNARAMSKEIHLPGMGSRVGLKNIAIFSRQFATLIGAGLTLIKVFDDPYRPDGEPGAGQDRRRRPQPGGEGHLALTSLGHSSESL